MWLLAVAYGLIQRSAGKGHLEQFSKSQNKACRIPLSWEVWCDTEPSRDHSKLATRNHSRCSVLLHRPGEEGKGTAFGFLTEKEKSWKTDLCIRENCLSWYAGILGFGGRFVCQINLRKVVWKGRLSLCFQNTFLFPTLSKKFLYLFLSFFELSNIGRFINWWIPRLPNHQPKPPCKHKLKYYISQCVIVYYIPAYACRMDICWCCICAYSPWWNMMKYDEMAA